MDLFPVKLEIIYLKLLHHRTILDILFMNSRTGILRPVVTFLFFASTYIIYQRYKTTLLSVSGKYINKLGSETLWVFVAQALAIPLLAALPLPRNILFNSLLTAFLLIAMWQIANRRELMASFKAYLGTLRTSYSQAKYNYLSQHEDI
jgi:hypothetical protein